MTTGIIALAVPGSAAFAGEFLILLGVFDTGWGWAVVGAVAIVLAAMYMLRLISAVLHEGAGRRHDAALDLRPPSSRSSCRCSRACSRSPRGRRRSASARSTRRRRSWRRSSSDRHAEHRLARASPCWRRSPAPGCAAALGRASAAGGAPSPPLFAAVGLVVGFVLAAYVYWKSPEARGIVADAARRDRLAAFAQMLIAGAGS